MLFKYLNIRIVFKPLFVPTLFLIIVFPILIFLGTWQINRLIWKEDLIKFYQNQSSSDYLQLSKKKILSEDIEFSDILLNGAIRTRNIPNLQKRVSFYGMFGK